MHTAHSRPKWNKGCKCSRKPLLKYAIWVLFCSGGLVRNHKRICERIALLSFRTISVFLCSPAPPAGMLQSLDTKDHLPSTKKDVFQPPLNFTFIIFQIRNILFLTKILLVNLIYHQILNQPFSTS